MAKTRLTRKQRAKERREAQRRNMTVEEWRQARGLNPDGTRDDVR